LFAGVRGHDGDHGIAVGLLVEGAIEKLGAAFRPRRFLILSFFPGLLY
jgi:hypothetical protein